jgi:hypothetical protein
MPGFEELKKEVKITYGLLISIISITFFVTKFYISQTTLEERQLKQYDRLDKRIHDIDQKLVDEKENI